MDEKYEGPSNEADSPEIDKSQDQIENIDEGEEDDKIIEHPEDEEEEFVREGEETNENKEKPETKNYNDYLHIEGYDDNENMWEEILDFNDYDKVGTDANMLTKNMKREATPNTKVKGLGNNAANKKHNNNDNNMKEYCIRELLNKYSIVLQDKSIKIKKTSS